MCFLLPAPMASAGPSTLRAGIGVFSAREDPVDLTDLEEDLEKLHLATDMSVGFDVLSGKALALGLDFEAWVTAGSHGGAFLTTVPILFGLRATLFSSSPVRLYGTGGAGPGIVHSSVTTTEIFPFPPIPTATRRRKRTFRSATRWAEESSSCARASAGCSAWTTGTCWPAAMPGWAGTCSALATASCSRAPARASLAPTAPPPSGSGPRRPGPGCPGRRSSHTPGRRTGPGWCPGPRSWGCARPA
jgi:hypothetical protein